MNPPDIRAADNAPAAHNPKIDMRIVTYNILNGGEGRADPLAEVIEAQRADIVSLVEADDPAVLERIANRLKMDYIHAAGERHAVALLSRWPIERSINHAAIHPLDGGCLLEATIVPPGRDGVVVGVIDLGDNHPNISAIVSRFDAPPALLMGSLRTASAGLLIESGFADLHAGDPVPTFPTSAPVERRDFIFAKGMDPTKRKTAWTEQDRLARYASDHFPIGVELSGGESTGNAAR